MYGRVHLRGLIVEVDLIACGPHELLRTRELCVYLPHVFGKDAAVRVHEHRGRRDVAGGGQPIERQPVHPRHFGHLVLPRRDRAAIGPAVVVEREVHAGAIVAVLIGRHHGHVACTRVAVERSTRAIEAHRHARSISVERSDRIRVVVPAGDADEGPYRDTAGQRAQCVLRARTDGEAPDTCRIDKRQRLEEPRRGFDVADLSGRDLRLPRFATALAETGEVEDEGGIAGLCEPARVGCGHLFFHGQPRSHGDDGGLPLLQRRGVAEEAANERGAVTVKHDRKFK